MKVFNREFDLMLDILKEEVKQNPGETIDITKPINLASLDTICGKKCLIK